MNRARRRVRRLARSTRVLRGDVHIAVSTGGESPRLSAELRKKLEEIL